MALCFLTPDAPIMPPDDPMLLPDGWVCGPPSGGDIEAHGAQATTLASSSPAVALTAHASATSLSSDLADG